MSNKNGLKIAQAIAFAMIHVDGRKDLDRQKLAAEVWPELSRNRQAQKLSAAENAGVATKEEVHKICEVCQVDANFLYETPEKSIFLIKTAGGGAGIGGAVSYWGGKPSGHGNGDGYASLKIEGGQNDAQ